MNPEITAIAEEYHKAQSAHEKSAALAKLIDLAGDVEPAVFLLEAWRPASYIFNDYKTACAEAWKVWGWVQSSDGAKKMMSAVLGASVPEIVLTFLQKCVAERSE